MNEAEFVVEGFSGRRNYRLRDVGVITLSRDFWNSKLPKPKYKRGRRGAESELISYIST